MFTLIENSMESWDGSNLFYRGWLPREQATKAVILFHRGHEHSGRWGDVIGKLDLPDTAHFAWDARGHGRSPGQRGHAPSFGALVRDVDAFVRHVSDAYGIPYESIIVLAQSIGGVVVSAWVHDYAPPLRGLVLGNPAFRVRLYAPFAIPALRLLNRLKPAASVSSYVKGRHLTHDPAKRQAYDSDPLIAPNIAVNILLGLHDAGTRLMRDSGAITTPVLMLTSGSDYVVHQSAQFEFFRGLSSAKRECERYSGFRHDIFNERDNHLPIGRARKFIQELFEADDRPTDMRNEDRVGYTKREFDHLSTPSSLLSFRGVGFAVNRFLMKTVGRLSNGIRLGWKTGFDSGAMLDYVYRDQASGVTPAGRWIDRVYLHSPGWRGIRQRKANLEALLGRAIDQVGDDVRILDVAAGHGRYVLDAIQSRRDTKITALLRDFCGANVSAGRSLAEALNISDVAYQRGDAFDPGSLAAIPTKPNIAIVSGLYELFPENAAVRESLAALGRLVEPGGFLIYTNQPWHPQIEFIARVLTSHRNGAPWIMRRRTQQEMDQLVAEAGFEKIEMLIDEHGIFSVSLARKPEPRPNERRRSDVLAAIA